MEHAWTELSLDVLGDNIRSMRAALCAGAEIVFVVKSDAYGHGMIPVSRCAIGNGVKWFAVAHMDEAVCLTDSFPDARVMILGIVQRDAVAEISARGITVLVADEEHGAELAAEAEARSCVLQCHVKVDTGMGRLGIHWERAAQAIEVLSRRNSLLINGICTHLASSDAPDTSYSLVQLDRFGGVVDDCSRRGISFKMRHVSNSGGFQNLPGCDYEAVRCGIELYGYSPRKAGARISTRPFLQWKSMLAQVRKVPAGFNVGYGCTHTTARATVLATVDVGYADGYCRLFGNTAHLLCGGRRVPVVGRVSMNLMTVDLGPGAVAKRGDEVILLGTQGTEAVWADELAKLCGTIPYEVLTNIRTAARYVVDAGGRRVPAQ